MTNLFIAPDMYIMGFILSHMVFIFHADNKLDYVNTKGGFSGL